jgi:hypothetical protein
MPDTRVRHNITRALTVIVLVILMAALLPQTASAQSKTLRWHRWDADIQINSDGTFRVKEVYEIEFIGGPFTFGYRNIPISQFDSLTNFAVSEGDTTYGEARSERAYTFSVSQDNEEYVVNWFYPSTVDETRVFTVEYTVHGGIIINEEVGDRFFWKAVAEHDFPVETSTVTVRMCQRGRSDARPGGFRHPIEPVTISEDRLWLRIGLIYPRRRNSRWGCAFRTGLPETRFHPGRRRTNGSKTGTTRCDRSSM